MFQSSTHLVLHIYCSSCPQKYLHNIIISLLTGNKEWEESILCVWSGSFKFKKWSIRLYTHDGLGSNLVFMLSYSTISNQLQYAKFALWFECFHSHDALLVIYLYCTCSIYCNVCMYHSTWFMFENTGYIWRSHTPIRHENFTFVCRSTLAPDWRSISTILSSPFLLAVYSGKIPSCAYMKTWWAMCTCTETRDLHNAEPGL